IIAEIARTAPPAVATFLLTSEREADAIIDQQRRCLTNTIQLCDELPPGAHAAIRAALPGIALVQVIHVTGEEPIRQAKAVAPQVNGLLLDSGKPSAAVKELGGTGRTHDWTTSRRIRQALDIPVFLAGGLNAGNVAEALQTVRPFGVDVCSGVRTNGRLDEEKLSAFMGAITETHRS
ncbi:MAG: phosphoribosylanthranilate isomerase, partial [Candidatus Neomarinimicrobiota bacterium]